MDNIEDIDLESFGKKKKKKKKREGGLDGMNDLKVDQFKIFFILAVTKLNKI